jgi:hypothetical protein
MPTCLGVEYDNTTVAPLGDIASNFTVADWLVASVGNPGCFTDGADGKLRINCMPSHLLYDDPILYYGEPGRAHLHHFFGNTQASNASTFSSLRTTGDGTCSGGPINRTAYWHPAMIRPQNNKVVKPTSYTIYYTVNEERDDRCDAVFGWQYAAQFLPRGFSFIGGWPDRVLSTHAVTTSVPEEPFKLYAEPTNTFLWSMTYDSGNAAVGPAGTLDDLADLADAAGGLATQASDHANEKLIGRFSLPTCWDGNNLTSANGRTHVTYKRQNGLGQPGCPASHPHHIPDLLFAVNYDHNGPSDFRQWYLSSDNGHGEPVATYPGGHTMHTDWFGAWDQGIIDIASDNVMGIGAGSTHVTCNNGGLNNDTALKESHLTDTSFRSEAIRYADIPDPPNFVAPINKSNKGRKHQAHFNTGWR